MKVLVPNTIELFLDVAAEIVEYDVAADIPAEHRDADVLVVWGNSKSQLARVAKQLSQVKLVQSLLAGADTILAAGFSDQTILCSGVGLHDRTVAEHTLALTLALVRKLPLLEEAKQQHRWANECGGMQPLYTKPITTLLGAKVLIWGFGSIAKTVAPLFTALGAEVTGVARSSGQRAGYKVVTEDQLTDELATTDLLIMILPALPATKNALNASRLAQLPKHAYLVNVGRGATVDEDALIAALTNGEIAGAALDVMKKEPLPADSPLWDIPNLILSPHGAGGRPVKVSEFVTAQLKALAAEQPLRNVL